MNIIMNPPYDGRLHLDILAKVIGTFPDAEIVNIAPCQWLSDPLVDYASYATYFNKFRESVKDKLCDDVDFIDKDEFNALFGAKSHFGVAITHYKKGQNFDTDKYKNKEPLTNKILSKVVKMDSLRSKFVRRTDDPLFVPVRRRTHHYLKWADYKSGAKEGILFSSESERDNFIASLDTWLYKWLDKFPLGENSAETPYLGDYTRPWTDEDLREYFSITDEEWKEIDETTK